MKNKRSEYLDFIRGFSLMAVFFNHLALFFPAALPILKKTYEPLGYFSFAEIFLIISAYTLRQYSFDLGSKPLSFSGSIKKSLMRFLKLYKAHFLILSAVIFMSFYGSWDFRGLKEIGVYSPLKSYVLGLFLLFQPQLIDILPIYMILTFVNPLILVLLQKKKVWVLALLSFVIWLCAQRYPLPLKLFYSYGVVLPYFNLLSWQHLYITVILLFLIREKIYARKEIVLIISLVICLALLASRYYFVEPNYLPYFLTSRQNMGPLRLINVLSFVCLSIVVWPTAKSFLIKVKCHYAKFFKTLSWVGQHSLYIFGYHVIVYHICKLFMQSWIRKHSDLMQFLVCLGLILLPLFIEYLWQKSLNERIDS